MKKGILINIAKGIYSLLFRLWIICIAEIVLVCSIVGLSPVSTLCSEVIDEINKTPGFFNGFCIFIFNIGPLCYFVTLFTLGLVIFYKAVKIPVPWMRLKTKAN